LTELLHPMIKLCRDAAEAFALLVVQSRLESLDPAGCVDGLLQQRGEFNLGFRLSSEIRRIIKDSSHWSPYLPVVIKIFLPESDNSPYRPLELWRIQFVSDIYASKVVETTRLVDKFRLVMRGLCSLMRLLPLHWIIRKPGRLAKCFKLDYSISQTDVHVYEFNEVNSKTCRMVNLPLDGGHFSISVTYDTKLNEIFHRTCIKDSLKDNYSHKFRETSKSQEIVRPKKIISSKCKIKCMRRESQPYEITHDEFKMDTPTSSSFQLDSSGSSHSESWGIKLSFSPFRGGPNKEYFINTPDESRSVSPRTHLNIHKVSDKEESIIQPNPTHTNNISDLENVWTNMGPKNSAIKISGK